MNKVKVNRWLPCLVIFAALFGPASGMGQAAAGSSLQLHFSVEDEGVKHPVSIPAEVLAELRKDSGVHDALDAQDMEANKLPVSWFSAAAVPLTGSDEKGLVVIGKGPLQGANVTTFWVFRRTPQGLQLVLTTVAHDLEFKNPQPNGYREIETTAATAASVTTVVYRMGDLRYVESSRKTEQIK